MKCFIKNEYYSQGILAAKARCDKALDELENLWK